MGFKETVINIAEKVGDTVDKGINMSKDSYNKLTEKNRIKKEVTRLNAEINNIFISVGRKLYNEEAENPLFATVFADVRAKEAEIAELNRQLSVLDGISACPVCGENVHKGDPACPKCGALLESKPETDAAVTEVFCSQCGAKLNSDAKFCNHCGAKV